MTFSGGGVPHRAPPKWTERWLKNKTKDIPAEQNETLIGGRSERTIQEKGGYSHARSGKQKKKMVMLGTAACCHRKNLKKGTSW